MSGQMSPPPPPSQAGPSTPSFTPPAAPPAAAAAPLGPPPAPLSLSFRLPNPAQHPVNLNSPPQSSFGLPPPGSAGRVGSKAPRRSRGRGSRGGIGRSYGPRSASARTSSRITSRYAGGSGGGGGAGVTKFKLSFKGAGNDPSARKTSFLGEYDRELDDNPEEPLVFEEQLILRVPKDVAEGIPGKEGSGLREMVKGKGKGIEGIEFKFLDSRRAAFKINGVTYASKLVDLPNIIESQKTHDSRHLFKVADISQMLIVDHPVKDESSITSTPLKIDDYIWPHGITPPMRHVRKRRFRKRISRRTIEVVEEQVEDLLKKDEEAEATEYDLIDALPDPEAPDSMYVDYDPAVGWTHLRQQHDEYGSEIGDGSEYYDDPGSVARSQLDWEDAEGEGEYDDDVDGEGDEGDGLDAELVAMLGQDEEPGGSDAGASGSEEEEEEDEEDEGEEGKSGDEEEDQETMEKKAKIRQLTSEIKGTEAAIEKKKQGFTGGNVIMLKRHEDQLQGLTSTLEDKIQQRQALLDEIEAAKPSRQPTDAGDGTPGNEDIFMGEDGEADAEGEADLDAEGERDEASPMPGPSRRASSIKQGAVASAEEEEDYEDLFGEEEDAEGEAETPLPSLPVAAESRSTADELKPSEGEEALDLLGEYADEAYAEGDAAGEGEGDETLEGDEMAALLDQALADEAEEEVKQALDSAQTLPLPQSQSQSQDELSADSAQGALRDLDAVAGGAAGGFGLDFGVVEGGVGMRRLASGLGDGDEEDTDSDDSDD